MTNTVGKFLFLGFVTLLFLAFLLQNLPTYAALIVITLIVVILSLPILGALIGGGWGLRNEVKFSSEEDLFSEVFALLLVVPAAVFFLSMFFVLLLLIISIISLMTFGVFWIEFFYKTLGDDLVDLIVIIESLLAIGLGASASIFLSLRKLFFLKRRLWGGPGAFWRIAFWVFLCAVVSMLVVFIGRNGLSHEVVPIFSHPGLVLSFILCFYYMLLGLSYVSLSSIQNPYKILTYSNDECKMMRDKYAKEFTTRNTAVSFLCGRSGYFLEKNEAFKSSRPYCFFAASEEKIKNEIGEENLRLGEKSFRIHEIDTWCDHPLLCTVILRETSNSL